MLETRPLFFALFAFMATLAPAHPSQTRSQTPSDGVRLEPHYYAGSRGAEPLFQSNFSAWKGWKTDRAFVSFHAEFESIGRRDRSIDLDRAWYMTEGDGARVFWGRMHPWEVAGRSEFLQSPERGRPWALLGASQAQNRGILLGSHGAVFPSPVLLGWIGPHLWVSPSERWSAGLSVTPLFVPSLGSEVALGDEISTGRFGRRPPGYVEVNGKIIPIHYRIDRSRIWEDVLLRPQAMAQTRWRYADALRASAFVSYAPQPDPVAAADGYLQVTAGSDVNVHAVAEVRPSFPYQWLAGLTHEYSLDKDWQLFLTVSYQQNPRWGYEVGLRHLYGEFSFLNETPSTPDRYTDELVQFEVHYPFWRVTPYAGIKRHLEVDGTWLRAGLLASLSGGWFLDIGSDIFAGGAESYFGEWRTNDRVYGVLQWAF